MTSRKLLSDAHAARIVASNGVGTTYQPSNSTEGDYFMGLYCRDCVQDVHESCPILARALIFDDDDPEYPTEWQYGPDGQPTCTAHTPIRED